MDATFSMKELFVTPQGQEFYRACCHAWARGGGDGDPPERYLVRLFLLVYRSCEPPRAEEGEEDERVLVHRALARILDEFQELAAVIEGYIDHRDTELFLRLLHRCHEHLDLAEFAAETLAELREAS